MKGKRWAKFGMLLSAPMLVLSLQSAPVQAQGTTAEAQWEAFDTLANTIKSTYHVNDAGVYEVIDTLGFMYYEGEQLHMVVDEPVPALANVKNVTIKTSPTITPSALKKQQRDIDALLQGTARKSNVTQSQLYKQLRTATLQGDQGTSTTILPDRMQVEVTYAQLDNQVRRTLEQTYGNTVAFNEQQEVLIGY